jgi:hypothetical protein
MAPMNKNTLRANTLPIDPDVRVPEAVRRAAAAAEAAQTASNATPAEPPPPPANDTITIAPPPAPQLPPGVTPLPTEQLDPNNPPAPAPVPPAPGDNDESWKAKYESQVGRVRQLTKLVGDQNGRITTLENLLSTASAAPQPQPTATPAELNLVTAKEIEDLGPEMIDIIRRLAREIAEPQLQTLKQEVSSLTAQLGKTSTTVVQSAREAMTAKMDADLPEWHEINVAPEFHAWLALPDPYSGVMRKQLLLEAFEQNKTPQVLAFFRGFISELAATTPAAAPTTQVEPAAVPPTPRVPLEQLAAPGRARTAATVPAPAEKPIIYTSDINAFYANKRKGLYIGREEEFSRHERELEAAMREGRVVKNT